MARLTPPYFFDEFLRPLKRNLPTARERQLGLTLKDLDWLHTLYYATDPARQNPRLRESPMIVEKLLINAPDKAAVPMAGAFMMSPSPDDQKALFYTPYAGIEVFDSRDELLDEVRNRINNNSEQIDLFSFLSIEQRDRLATETTLTLTTALIDGAVLEDQMQDLQACQLHNRQAMLEQLRKMPTLPWMLDTLLGIMAQSYFPGLDQRDTRVNSFIDSPGHNNGDAPGHWVASASLSETLLQFYLSQAWPVGQTRSFVNPRYVTAGLTPAQRDQNQQLWELMLEQTAGILSKLLRSLLLTYWNQDASPGRSRRELFAQVLSDTFRTDLLQKRQDMLVSADESLALLDTLLPDPNARSATPGNLQIEKVRIQAPYQHYVELAGTLMIKSHDSYLYTQSKGLQVLRNLDEVKDFVLSMLKARGHKDELLNFLSLDERSIFIGLDPLQVSGVPVTGAVFSQMIDDIVQKQLDNLDHALGIYRRSNGAVDLGALLDNALDVRSLLDNRLHSLDAGGRWSLHPVTSTSGHPSTVQAERAKQLLQQLRTLNGALTAQRRNHPTLRSLAAHALNAELEQRKLDLKADEVYINTYATAAQQREERLPQTSASMLEHFIQRLAGAAGPVDGSPRTGFYGPRRDGAAARWNSLSSATFNAIVNQVMGPFIHHDIRTLPRLFLEHHQRALSQGMLAGLRGEAQLRQMNNTLAQRSHAILDTVLHPDSLTRLTRHGLNGFLPDAYGLSLKLGADAQVCPLANCFALTERGGTDPLYSGHALLWTPQRGHESFASIQLLRQGLEQRLAHPQERLSLLENLPISRRIPHQACALGPLQRIDGHLLNHCQQSHRDYVLDGIDHLLSLPLGPLQLQDRLDDLLLQAAPTNLPRAMAVARATINQQALPVWLGMALPQEQILHAELLEQYCNSAPLEQDYLHAIKPLREHVVSTLATLLKARYPDQTLDPEQILIPGRIVLQDQPQTLADFALGHLPDLQGDTIDPQSRNATPLPATLDGHAIVQMIRQLNLEKAYRERLTTHLLSPTEEARQRRLLFCRQLPWQLLRQAHEEKLEERLSASAWSFVQQIVDMPDAVARDDLGATAMIRPLELIATPGAAAVKALGIYLIGPRPGATGPLVLYTPYCPQQVLKEYAHEDDLLAHINRPGALQDWVLCHLESPHQATYRNLLRQQPRPQGSHIQLASSPIRGNILSRLFDDNAQQMLRMLGCQFDREGASQWQALTGVLTKVIPTALHFIAGKLTYPLTVWRSYTLFKTSSEHLQQHRWREGLKTFIRGVAELASLRKAFDSFLPSTPPAAQEPSEVPAHAPATTLASLDITAPQRTRLQAFETPEVALADLKKSPLSHVYKDEAGARYFVPLAGKVYPVKKAGERWRLSNREHPQGPYVQRNTQGRWVLDPSLHNPRYGKSLSRYAGGVLTRLAEREFINIEAHGMQQIAALSSWKAQAINEALNVATYYAVNCKRNITLFAQQRDPDSRLGRFFSELFGVIQVTAEQVQKIDNSVDDVLNELVNHTLTNPDSKRFVCGTSRYDPMSTYAFILHDDVEQKIYLLDRFFDPCMDVYQNRLTTPFNLSAHARAATLIHELTHLKSSTEDIAYLDSMRPFHDLINLGAQGTQVLKTDLSDLRTTALSTLTPATLLFKTWDGFSDSWQDLGEQPATESIRARVLKITGGRNLDEARHIFMTNEDKRVETILANADSVTYLITQLGRELDAGG